jgi:hypothetical protein
MHAALRRIVLIGIVAAGGCASRDAFRLVHPPAGPDAHLPGGVRLLTKAPLGEWVVGARFASRAACERARQEATDRAIADAEARVGDDAKNDLGVRRAVNARCVRSARLDAPES